MAEVAGSASGEVRAQMPAAVTSGSDHQGPPTHTHTSHSEMMFMMSPNFGAAVGIESNLQITWHGTRMHRDSGVRFTTLVTHLTGKNQPAAQREPRLGGCAVKPLVVQAGALWAECFLSFSQGSESGLNLEHRVGFCEGACGGGGQAGTMPSPRSLTSAGDTQRLLQEFAVKCLQKEFDAQTSSGPVFISIAE